MDRVNKIIFKLFIIVIELCYDKVNYVFAFANIILYFINNILRSYANYYVFLLHIDRNDNPNYITHIRVNDANTNYF